MEKDCESSSTEPIAISQPVLNELPIGQGTGHKIGGQYVNGECWLDERGHRIQGHGAGMLYHEGVYYWYGESRDGQDIQINGQVTRFAVGIACSRSTDLVTWTPLGIVLPTHDDPRHDLHPTRVLERPKVIYNANTRQFVLWLHVDSCDYEYARAGVAVSDSPAGPFQYLESFRPNGLMSRDQTIFVDRAGHAFHICATDDNATTMISLLSDDYLRPSGKYEKAFDNRSMEAFAFCEFGGRYWMIASGCTGWSPNEARSAVADSMLGPWEELGNPCVGQGAELTFHGQSCFILPPGGANQNYIAMFDIWRPKSLTMSGYLWLPICWNNGRMVIRHHSMWPG